MLAELESAKGGLRRLRIDLFGKGSPIGSFSRDPD